MSLPNAITREDFYLNKIANPSDDHELPDAITRQQHYLKAIAENAGGGGGGGSEVNYSTEEKLIGTWIDEKPLYQKTLTYNTTISLNDSSWTIIPFMAVPSMDYCAVIFMTTDCIFDNRIRLKYENGDIKGATSQESGQNVNNITVTIQYTKTTDNVGT